MSSTAARRALAQALAGFARLAAVWLACAIASVAAQEPLRPEVGRPLQAAQELVGAHRYKEALARVREAEAVGGRSAYETFMIERMRIAAASAAGDAETAARAFEALAASGRLSAPERARMAEAIAGIYYRSRDYVRSSQWARRHFQEGGSSPAARTLLVQSEYLGGDYRAAVKDLVAEVQAAEREGAKVPEERLSLLADAATKANDGDAATYALERLVAGYPRKEYWALLLAKLQRKPGLSPRLTLDTYRLRLAAGTLSQASDYMEMAQLALQADLPAESQRVLERGFAAGALGSGPEAERHKRLRELADRKAAEARQVPAGDAGRPAGSAAAGDALVQAGFAVALSGEPAKGAHVIEQALAGPGVKRLDEARLHLGIARFMAGELPQAQAAFKAVGGKDGSAELARLWLLLSRGRS